MDMLMPFLKESRQRKYLLVMMDYFIKWVKAIVMAFIIANQVRKFIWKNIITHFSVPQVMIFYNGQQFDDNKIKDYLKSFSCQAQFTTLAHTQTNG